MVDVLLATYNGSKYLNALLESLEKQTYEEWRLIVSDDQSSDTTMEIIQEFQKKSRHEVVILNEQKKFGGAKKNFFYLLENATSDYVMFCDQDDVWLENKVESSVFHIKQMERKYGIDVPLLASMDLQVVNNELKVINQSFYDYSNLDFDFSVCKLLCQNRLPGCTMIINNVLRKMALEYKDINKITMHDSWIGLIAAAFGKIEVDNSSKILYRQHGENSVGAQKARSIVFVANRLRSIKQLRDENIRRIIEANEFVNTFGKNRKIPEEIVIYSQLMDKSKSVYRKTCVKYGILKFPRTRALLQLLVAHK